MIIIKQAACIVKHRADEQFCLTRPQPTATGARQYHTGVGIKKKRRREKSFNTVQRNSGNQVTQQQLLFYPIFISEYTLKGELIVCNTAPLEETFIRTLTQRESGEKTI